MKIYERKPNPQRRLDEFVDIPVVPFNWSAYNQSQAKEKELFFSLLYDLCQSLGGTSYLGKGRPSAPSNHMIFCMCAKVYAGVGSRRLEFDLQTCRNKRYIASVPSCGSVWNYFNSKALTHKLKYLIRLSALPLAQVENKGSFSIDSSGVSENKYLPRWSKIKQEFHMHKQYQKIHCIVGNKTNVIVSTLVTPGEKADSPHFKQLLQEAAERFDVKDICADMGYLSRNNLKFADDLGITPFIPFKKNSTMSAKGSMIWHKMYNFFKDNAEEFSKRYHQRSNIESTFFMIEQRFGKYVYSKNPVAQVNEILAKILCHNLAVLIQELFISKIEIDFNSISKGFSAQE